MALGSKTVMDPFGVAAALAALAALSALAALAVLALAASGASPIAGIGEEVSATLRGGRVIRGVSMVVLEGSREGWFWKDPPVWQCRVAKDHGSRSWVVVTPSDPSPVNPRT